MRHFQLTEPLRPFFTSIYRFEAVTGPGESVVDCLFPEWAVLRFASGQTVNAAAGSAPLLPTWPFIVTGPASRALRFDVQSCVVWGVGLQPAGWARFIDTPAADFANSLFDGATHAAFRAFAPLGDIVNAPDLPAEAVAARITAHLALLPPGPDAKRVTKVRAVHAALRDPAIANVYQIADQVGVSTRTLERICARWFGFPAKQELRRQRFLRSMARFMMSGYRSWSEALDERYYDQAQFVRDFRAFMDMTPSEFAEMPHPVLYQIMARRLVDQGVEPPAEPGPPKEPADPAERAPRK